MAQRFSRRDLLRRAGTYGLGTAFALEQLGGVPLLGTWASDYLVNPLSHRLDAYAMMANALRGGAAALAVHKAMAAGEDDWAVVQIKVCNHVHTPLVFAFGQYDGTTLTRTGVPNVTSRAGQAATTL